MKKNTVNTSQVKHIAQLSNIPVSDDEGQALAKNFDETLAVIDSMQTLDTKKVEPTHQVTGLENVWREDKVDEQRMFSQKQALTNATKTHHGYFVVPRVIDTSDH